MEEYIIEINRSLTFQRVNSELRYKPDDPFIRTIVIGIRPKGSETEDEEGHSDRQHQPRRTDPDPLRHGYH